MDQFSYACKRCGGHEQFDWIAPCVVELALTTGRPSAPAKWPTAVSQVTTTSKLATKAAVAAKSVAMAEARAKAEAEAEKLAAAPHPKGPC